MSYQLQHFAARVAEKINGDKFGDGKKLKAAWAAASFSSDLHFYQAESFKNDLYRPAQ